MEPHGLSIWAPWMSSSGCPSPEDRTGARHVDGDALLPSRVPGTEWNPEVQEDGHRKRYFIARAFVEAQRRILAVLRQDVPRKIVLELLFFGERTFGELQASVGVSKSTLSYHLQKLMHREVLLRGRRERESVFSIKDLEEVRKLLLANQSSFQDDAVDRFADLWTRIRT